MAGKRGRHADSIDHGRHRSAASRTTPSVAADAAGLRPNRRSCSSTATSCGRRPSVPAPRSTMPPADSPTSPYVENITSPFDQGGSVTDDGHSALVEFEIAGDSTEATDRVDPTIAAVDDVGSAQTPTSRSRSSARASAAMAINDDDQRRPRQGREAVAADHADHPHDRVRLAARGRRAAVARPQRRDRRASGSRRSPASSFPADPSVPAVILMIGLAVGVDYSLFYLRREREERAPGTGPDAALADRRAPPPGRAVLVSGITVMVAMAGMFISGDPAFISFAIGTMLVVALAIIALADRPAGDARRAGRPPGAGPDPGLRDRSTPEARRASGPR